MRRLVSWIAGVLILAVALSGCGIVDRLDELVGGDGEAEPTSSVGPVTLKQPLQIRPVTEVSAQPCASGTLSGTDTACYRLAEETLTIERVKDLDSGVPEGSTDFAIMLTLYPDDAKAFGELTGRLAKEQTPRNQLAVVVGDKVVTAPAVMDAITGGQVQIAGNFTKADAEKLVQQLTG